MIRFSLPVKLEYSEYMNVLRSNPMMAQDNVKHTAFNSLSVVPPVVAPVHFQPEQSNKNKILPEDLI